MPLVLYDRKLRRERTDRKARVTSPGNSAVHCTTLAAQPRVGLQASGRGPVAQGIEQQPSKLKVAGSNPAGVATKLALLELGVPQRSAWGTYGAQNNPQCALPPS